jgi:hypothetical protein
MRQRLVLTCVIGALSVLCAPAAHAFSSGIDSTVFGLTGCPLCHAGGTPPSVVLSGPTAVAPNDTVEYTFTIFGTTTQNLGGFNVAAPLGALTTGGPFAAGTQAIAGSLGLAEITHRAPKQGDFLSVVEFSFHWTAPADFTSVTLRAWGNAVDGGHSPNGDAATLATLEVFAAGAAPTATETPDVAPTPTRMPGADVCGDAAPLSPALIADPAAQLCQAAIAKAGAVYLKKDHKAVRKCLEALQGGEGGADPIAACVGGASVLPTDAKASGAIAKAQAKALTLLQKKCPDAALQALDACAGTASALASCVLAAHRQAVVDAVGGQYGVVTASPDTGVAKCQKAIGSTAAGHLIAYLRASQKCLVQRNKAGGPVDGAAECVGAIAADGFAPPRNVKAAAAEASGAAKLMTAIETKCTDAQIAALDTCGSDRASAAACLLCAHRSTVFAVITSEFGGLP